MLQHNTLLFWGMITLSIVITLFFTRHMKTTRKQSKTLFNSVNLTKLCVGFLVYNIVFWTQEYLYFVKHVSFRSEKEALANGYDWFDFTTNQDNFDLNRGDLSEGCYDGDYTLKPEEAMQKKYKSYYNYLNLGPGKTLVDLGSGYCHWTEYCKKRGVIVKGVTLSKPQKDFCESKRGITVIIDDFRHFVQTTEERFDAVSAIGTQEHLASMGMTQEQASEIYSEMFRNIRRILRPEGRALVTIMLMNPDYPKWTIDSDVHAPDNTITLKDKIHIYNLTSFYGCGRYPLVDEYTNYAKQCFDIIKIKNYTEDYRWAGINFGDHHWQNSEIHINTPYRLMKFIQYFFTDPWFWGRINYSAMKSWYWQFGGDQKTPIYNNNKSPILANIYVLTPKKEQCSGKSNPNALKVL